MASNVITLPQAGRFRVGRLLTWLILGVVFLPLPTSTAEPTSHYLHLEASSFAFSPHTIRVNPGDRVVIELHSTDVVHGLHLDGYELSATVDPGQTSQLSFIADRPGTYRFRCSVTCGPLHPFMIGKLQVGSQPLLQRGIILAVLLALVSLWRWPR